MCDLPSTAFPSSRHLWVSCACFFSLIAVWGFEILYFQATTLQRVEFSSLAAQLHFIGMKTTLTCATFLMVSICALLLSHRWRIVLLLGNFCFFIVVTEYSNAFGRVLLLQSVVYQSSDLFSVLTLSTDWVSSELVLGLGLVFLLKFGLSRQAEAYRVFLGKRVRPFAGIALVLYVCMLGRIAHRQRFLNEGFRPVRRYVSFDYVARQVGYLPAWLAEYILIQPAVALQNAETKRRARLRKTILPPREFRLPKHIVAIQLESIGFDLLHVRHAGKQIVPFLSKLSRNSLFLKIKPFHLNGSADADFVFLNRIEPSDYVANYRLPGFVYKNTTSELIRSKGYQTTFLHNFTGFMFDRRVAYEQMHFDQLLFREELQKMGGRLDREGRPLDEVVFQRSIEMISEAQRPTFHFIITYTSHKPFDNYQEWDSQPIATPATRLDNFLNSANYLDTVLANYVEKLPENTLLLIYSDHESTLKQLYRPMEDLPEVEFVPAFLFQKGGTSPVLTEGFDQRLLMSGELRMLDLAHFFHDLIKAGVAWDESASSIEH